MATNRNKISLFGFVVEGPCPVVRQGTDLRGKCPRQDLRLLKAPVGVGEYRFSGRNRVTSCEVNGDSPKLRRCWRRERRSRSQIPGNPVSLEDLQNNVCPVAVYTGEQVRSGTGRFVGSPRPEAQCVADHAVEWVK